jgi:predicted DNA-binding transcriptional regulator YafY
MSGKEYDTIATRLARIITRLNEGACLDLEELREDFNVSLRTLQRDFNERLASLPLYKKDGRYCIEDYALGKLTYSDIRNFAEISGVLSLYPSLDQSFVVDILSNKVNQIFRVNALPHDNRDNHADWFKTIGASILSHRVLRFDYHDKPRSVHPYKLINNDGVWYLLADEKETLKLFAIGKIKSLNATDDVFIPNPEMQERAQQRDTRWFSDTETEVVLRIDHAVSDYFIHRDLLPNQTLLDDDREAITLATRTQYPDEILRLVRQWIPHIRIVEPSSLARQLKDELNDFLQKI